VEPEEIASIVQKIVSSDMSVDEYFQKHSVPFSRPQYFRYKARLAVEGLDGLRDGRNRGNHRKLTPNAEGYLRGVHRANPGLSLQQIRESLEATLGIDVDRSTVSRFLRGRENRSSGRGRGNRRGRIALAAVSRSLGRWRCIWAGQSTQLK